MTRQRIVEAAISVLVELRDEWKIPYDTGNMANNALKYKVEGKYMTIYFDTKVAPYIFYTNEPWISDKWKGKKNPNQGWWDIFATEFAERLAKRLRGKIV